MSQTLALSRRLAWAGCLMALVALSCIEVRDPNVEGPEDVGNLVVVGQADPATVFEGGSASLSVHSEGGTQPLTYRWEQNGGPDVDIDNADSADAQTGALTEVGLYTFRITVTDSNGFYETDYVTVEVLSAVTVDAPTYAIVGEPARLTASVSSESGTPTYRWEVTGGTATIDDPSAAAPNLTASLGETVTVQLTVAFAGDTQPATTRELAIVAVNDLSPRVGVETNLGDFVIELDGENTPRHMVNFLQYVDEGFYEGLLFHRNACSDNADTGECDPFVLQGGGYRRVDGELVEVAPTHDAIPPENETSASNGELYTVALALRGGSSGSGAVQFFINLDVNDFLDDEGFTAFGRVVEGTDVVDAMAATDRVESPIIFGEVSLPAEDIVIERMTRVE